MHVVRSAAMGEQSTIMMSPDSDGAPSFINRSPSPPTGFGTLIAAPASSRPPRPLSPPRKGVLIAPLHGLSLLAEELDQDEGGRGEAHPRGEGGGEVGAAARAWLSVGSASAEAREEEEEEEEEEQQQQQRRDAARNRGQEADGRLRCAAGWARLNTAVEHATTHAEVRTSASSALRMFAAHSSCPRLHLNMRS